jgi:hypothetical protein
VDPISCYKTYLSIKNHFSKRDYDFFKYNGKTKVSEKTFYSKKDRFWFEKLSRKKSDKEIIDFFVSNYSSSDDPSNLWIGNIIKEGESIYEDWIGKRNNLPNIFYDEISNRLTKENFESYFQIQNNRHPILLKDYLKKEICIETLIILDKILRFKKDFDNKIIDPIWETVSLKMEKYSPFLNVDIFKYKKILKECVL